METNTMEYRLAKPEDAKEIYELVQDTIYIREAEEYELLRKLLLKL